MRAACYVKRYPVWSLSCAYSVTAGLHRRPTSVINTADSAGLGIYRGTGMVVWMRADIMRQTGDEGWVKDAEREAMRQRGQLTDGRGAGSGVSEWMLGSVRTDAVECGELLRLSMTCVALWLIVIIARLSLSMCVCVCVCVCAVCSSWPLHPLSATDAAVCWRWCRFRSCTPLNDSIRSVCFVVVVNCSHNGSYLSSFHHHLFAEHRQRMSDVFFCFEMPSTFSRNGLKNFRNNTRTTRILCVKL